MPSSTLPLVVAGNVFKRAMGTLVNDAATRIVRGIFIMDSRGSTNGAGNQMQACIVHQLGTIHGNIPELFCPCMFGGVVAAPMVGGCWAINTASGSNVDTDVSSVGSVRPYWAGTGPDVGGASGRIRRVPVGNGTDGTAIVWDGRMHRNSLNMNAFSLTNLWKDGTLEVDVLCPTNVLNETSVRLRHSNKANGASFSFSAAVVLNDVTIADAALNSAVYDVRKLTFTNLTTVPNAFFGVEQVNSVGAAFSGRVEVSGLRIRNAGNAYGLAASIWGRGGARTSEYPNDHADMHASMRAAGPVDYVVLACDINDCFGSLHSKETFKANVIAATALARAQAGNPSLPVIYWRVSPHGTNLDTSSGLDRTALWDSYGDAGDEIAATDPFFGMFNSLPFLESMGFNRTKGFFTGLTDAGTWNAGITVSTTQYTLHRDTYWTAEVTTVAGDEPGTATAGGSKFRWLGFWVPGDAFHPTDLGAQICAEMFCKALMECGGFAESPASGGGLYYL